jgi:hypothetical protein
MRRRELIQMLGAVGFTTVVPRLFAAQTAKKTVPYQSYGDSGPAIIVGPGFRPTSPAIATVRSGYLDRLTDRYRVIVMDYPPIGSDAVARAPAFTPANVSADILAVADSAGVERFVWYGYSIGAVMGLQLAIRTNRLTALICGGWPPLGAPYKQMVSISETGLKQGVGRPEIITYYKALQEWDERSAVSKLTCPRMAFAGRDDVIPAFGHITSIGPTVAEHREELERMGWKVQLVYGFKHDLFNRPEIVVPLIREFLDPLLLRG